MAYLCSYIPRDPASKNQFGEARIITRGFACTRDELQRELETACRAKRRTLVFEWITPESIDAWRDHYRQNGSTIYINREGFGD